MENEFEKGFMCGYLINYHVDDEPKPDQKTWTYPSSWLKLPEPADNQIVMLVDNRGSSVYNNTNYTFGTRLNLDGYHPVKVEWGDGSSDELTRNTIHTYEQGSGHKVGNSEQWIVTFTFYRDENSHVNLYALSSSDDAYVLAIKIGNTKYVSSSNLDCAYSRLQYAKICRGEFNFRIDNSRYLRKVELHKNITTIPASAFFYSYSLIDINLENITDLGNYAFECCCSMDFSGKMPNLKTIGDYGLAYTNTSSLDFPSLESIGEYAFFSCNKLTECASETLKTIGTYAFDSCRKLKNVDLPYVTEIGQRAFQACNVLETVNLPLVKKIGTYCFLNNFSLTTVDLRSCTDIGGYLFSGCYSLNHCILPASVNISDPKVIGENFNDMVEVEHGEEENVNA